MSILTFDRLILMGIVILGLIGGHTVEATVAFGCLSVLEAIHPVKKAQ